MALGHWFFFTSPAAMIVIPILVMVVAFGIWKKGCCRSNTATPAMVLPPALFPLALLPSLVIHKKAATMTITPSHILRRLSQPPQFWTFPIHMSILQPHPTPKKENESYHVMILINYRLQICTLMKHKSSQFFHTHLKCF